VTRADVSRERDGRYLPHIDGLRGLAIVLVVVFHTWPNALPGGFVGVDVFFVVSGFIITRTLCHAMDSGGYSYVGFLTGRVKRLVPAAVVCTAFTAAAALVLAHPPELMDFGRSLVAAWTMSANFFFMATTGYFDGPSERKPLLHMWSLAVEDQFYLTWPLILLAMTAPRWRRWAVWIVPLALAASLAHAELTADASQRYAFYSPLTRAHELLAGCWLAVWVHNGRRLPEAMTGGPAGILGFFSILLSALLLSSRSAGAGSVVVPTVIGTALLIGCGLNSSNVCARLLSRPLPMGIGKISYSWYLYHWPVLAIFRLGAERTPGFLESLLLAGFGLMAALVSWSWVEQPWRRKPAGAVSAIGGALGVTAAFVAAGVLLVGARGIPGRFDEGVARMYAAMNTGNPVRARCDGTENALRRDGECNVGAPKVGGSFDVVVLGDSNADHFVPMISVLAKARRLSARKVTQSTCAPLLGASQVDAPKSRLRVCEEYQRAVMDFVERNPGLKFAVLGGVWSSWTYGLEANAAFARVARVPPDDGTFGSFAKATVEYLRARRIRVVLLGQIPHMRPFDVGCYGEVARNRLDAKVACLTDRARVEAQLAGPRVAFRRLAAHDDEVRFFDPSDVLCGDTGCSPFKGELFLYKDFGHLNAMGSIFLAGPARSVLEKGGE